MIRVQIRPNPERNKPEKFRKFWGIKERERGKQPVKWKELPKGRRKNEKDLNLSNGKNITKEEKQNSFKKILTIIFWVTKWKTQERERKRLPRVSGFQRVRWEPLSAPVETRTERTKVTSYFLFLDQFFIFFWYEKGKKIYWAEMVAVSDATVLHKSYEEKEKRRQITTEIRSSRPAKLQI